MEMIPFYKSGSSQCEEVRALLSEYTDNCLPARRAWELEKHLMGCAACAAEAREMQATVQLLRSAPRYDTGDSFMASLHARLDAVDPGMAPALPVWQRMRGWLSAPGSTLLGSRVPAMSFGLAVAALALVLTVHRPQEVATVAPAPYAASDGEHVSVAASASNPFSDPAADNLEFRSIARGARTTTSF